MPKFSVKAGLIAVFLVLGLGLGACGGGAKPFDYQPAADEMKPGPGLFSGADGEFVIYGE